MTAALHDAALSPMDVGYINAHATSTPSGDITELMALNQVFANDGGHKVSVSATKAATGHMLGAAGGMSSICYMYCI